MQILVTQNMFKIIEKYQQQNQIILRVEEIHTTKNSFFHIGIYIYIVHI